MFRTNITIWLILAVVALFVGLVFDAAALATEAWGYTEETTFYSHLGLWKFCNGTRTLHLWTKEEIARGDTYCTIFTDLDYQWFKTGLAMEIIGAIAAAAVLCFLVALMITLRCEWTQSRAALVAIIPLSFLAAIFNLIGVVVLGVEMRHLQADPGYSVALDSLGAIFCAMGGVFGIFDMQRMCLRTRPELLGKGLTRQI